MGLYIILMGVQGSGKGTQAGYITHNYGGIPQISTGDLFRAMKTRTDDLAKQIQELMAEGKLIDDDTTNKVVEDRLQQPDAANGAIFDGFPRTPYQAQWLQDYLEKKGEKIGAVILMKIDLYGGFRRAFGRLTSPSGESYNVYTDAEKIDVKWVEHPEKAFPPRLEATVKSTGEKLVRRPDDASADAIIKRIDTFVKTTQPLIDHFSAKGLVHTIDADQSIAAVSAAISKILDAAN
ncbi:MAG: nucleoside monophosphate kinase [Chloroflexi bacterium]|nr:nucleoside monophosphate kinase [Chloroflexota bacterium]MCC6896204.1 nucleoside monophosphate kinase [Anaerolineae bacterium]